MKKTKIGWSGKYDDIGQKIPEIKENHKYIGFHNQKEVVSCFGPNKSYAERKCKELLLGYFHDLQDNVTKFPLEYYNGVVAYVGVKKEQPKKPEINSKQLEFNFEPKKTFKQMEQDQKDVLRNLGYLKSL